MKLKKVLSVIMAVLLFCSVFSVASAATYSHVNLNVPYFRQRASGMCSFCAFSMAEAYATGYGANSDVVYQAIRTAHAPSGDGGYVADPARSPALIDGKRYKSITLDYATIYSYLKNGQPVVIYRTGSDSLKHWAVIYGYTGSTTTLQWENFQVINGVLTQNNNYVKKESLKSFLSASGAKLSHAVVRVNGVLAHKNNTSYSQEMNSYFANCSVYDITETNATIKGIFINNTSISSAGFYIGTDSNNLKKITKNLSGGSDGAGTCRSIFYSMNKWYGILKAGTKYYYKLYYIKGGKEYTSPVNWFVTKGQSVTLSSISVSTLPTNVNYYVGETLNTSGLTLSAKYSDNSVKTITSGFTCSPTAFTKTGIQTVTVTYSGKTTIFSVNVKEKVTETTTVTTTIPPTTTTIPAVTTTVPIGNPSDESTTAPSVVILKGDMNLDGRINASDARIALRIAAQLETAEGLLFTIGDVNEDGKINAMDARKILRVAAQIETM